VSALLQNSAGTVSESVGRSAAEAHALLESSAGALSDSIGRSAARGAPKPWVRLRASASGLLAQERRFHYRRHRSQRERSRADPGGDQHPSPPATFSAKPHEFNAAAAQRLGDMTRLLDEKSNTLLSALSGKGLEFAGEVSRVTDHAVKSIEAKSFVFTQTMMDNSEEIARLINDASQAATSAMSRTLGQLQEGTLGTAEIREGFGRANPAGFARRDQGGDRGVEKDGVGDGGGTAGDARHAALRLHRAVRSGSAKPISCCRKCSAGRTKT